jgi:cytochrome o ubiquinol oxidase operon protein cyoD
MPTSPRLSKMAALLHGGKVTTRPYLIGVVLALVLTVIPFGFVAAHMLRPIQLIGVIDVAAIAQVVVHLRYFLHLDLKPSSQNQLIALCFAAVVLIILVGGTLWIMFHLNYRMVSAAGRLTRL